MESIAHESENVCWTELMLIFGDLGLCAQTRRNAPLSTVTKDFVTNAGHVTALRAFPHICVVGGCGRRQHIKLSHQTTRDGSIRREKRPFWPTCRKHCERSRYYNENTEATVIVVNLGYTVRQRTRYVPMHGAVQHAGCPVVGSRHAGAETLHWGAAPLYCTTTPLEGR